MITDEMLQAAAGEVSACMDISLSTHPERLFSRRFQRKMNHLIRKTDYPIRHTLSTCAAIFAITLTIFATLLTLSPTVRATVLQWLKLPYKGDTAYYHEGQALTEKRKYLLTKIPEGFTLDEALEFDEWGSYRYNGPQGAVLWFGYHYGGNQQTVFVSTSGYEQHTVSFKNGFADIYLSQNTDESSVIMWTDSENGALLSIHYQGNMEELIDLAERVKLEEKN